MKHFSRHKVYATMALNDEDDELEALRLAALQTIKPRRNQFPHSGRFHRIDNNPNLIAIVPLDKTGPAGTAPGPNLFPNITVIQTEDSPTGEPESQSSANPPLKSPSSAIPVTIIPSDNVGLISPEKPTSTESIKPQVAGEVIKEDNDTKENIKEENTPDTTFEDKLDYEEEDEDSEEDHDFVSLDDEDLSLEKLMDQMEQEFSQCNGKSSKKSKSQKKSKKKSDGGKEASSSNKKSPVTSEQKTKVASAAVETASAVEVTSSSSKSKAKPTVTVEAKSKPKVAANVEVKAKAKTTPVEVKPPKPVIEPPVPDKVPENEVKPYSPPSDVKVKSYEKSRSRSPVRGFSRSPVRRRSPRWSPKARRSPSPKYKRDSPRRYRRSDSPRRSPVRKYRASPGRSPSPRRRRGLTPDRKSPPRAISPTRRKSPYRSLSPRDKRKSPYRAMSPDRRKSPYRGVSPRKKSPYRGTSPIKRKSPSYRPLSPIRKKSPYRGVTPPKRKSPFRAASPIRRKSPYRGVSPVKFRAGSRSPIRKKSPYRSGSPVKRKSPFRAASPLKRKSPYRASSPARYRSASPPPRRKSPYRASPSRRKSPITERRSQSPGRYSPRRKSPVGRNSPKRKQTSPYRSPRRKKASPTRYESPTRKRNASPDYRRSDSPVRRSPKRQSPQRKRLSPSARPASPRRRYSPSRSPTRRHRRSTSPQPTKPTSSESHSSRSKGASSKKSGDHPNEESVRTSRSSKRTHETRDKPTREKLDPVLEARRRKFQSNSLVGSGASLNKKIRLKPLSEKDAAKPSVKSVRTSKSGSRTGNKVEKSVEAIEEHIKSRDTRTITMTEPKLTSTKGVSTRSEKGVDTQEHFEEIKQIMPEKKVVEPVTKCDFSTQVTLEEDSQPLEEKPVKPPKKEKMTKKLLKRKSSESEKEELFLRRKKISVNIRPTALQALEEKSRRRSERQQMLKREEGILEEDRDPVISTRWKQRGDQTVDLVSAAELTTHSKAPDLRAELSRRRAQRLKGIGSMGPTRLVQSALEGVVKKKDEEKLSLHQERSISKKKSKTKIVDLASDVSAPSSSKIRRVQILHVEHPTLNISDSEGSEESAVSSDDSDLAPTKGRSILARNQV